MLIDWFCLVQRKRQIVGLKEWAGANSLRMNGNRTNVAVYLSRGQSMFTRQ